jgi:hypothetical protein
MNPIDIFMTPLFGLELPQLVATLLIILISVKWILPPIISEIVKLFRTKHHLPHEEGFLTDHPMVESRGSTGFQMIKVIAIIVVLSVGVILVNEVIPINAMIGSDPRAFPNSDQKVMIEFCENKLSLFQYEWDIEDPEMFMTRCVNGGAEDPTFFRSYIPTKDMVELDITNGTK